MIYPGNRYSIVASRLKTLCCISLVLIHRLRGFDNRPEHPCPLSLCERVFEISLPAAFTAALLNNQPMGFYSPAVPVHDAQLHGLRPHQRFRLVGVALSNFCDPEMGPLSRLFLPNHAALSVRSLLS